MVRKLVRAHRAALVLPLASIALTGCAMLGGGNRTGVDTAAQRGAA